MSEQQDPTQQEAPKNLGDILGQIFEKGLDASLAQEKDRLLKLGAEEHIKIESAKPFSKALTVLASGDFEIQEAVMREVSNNNSTQIREEIKHLYTEGSHLVPANFLVKSMTLGIALVLCMKMERCRMK